MPIINIKLFYQILFWATFLVLICILSDFSLPIDINKLKGLGLPLAAILFAIGTLWHKKEDQEFERRKHSNEMNLAFRQIRWGYYSLLKEVVATILFLSEEDILPQETAFKDTKYGKLWANLSSLENEGEVLFNESDNINGKIILIREKMKEKARLLGNIYSKRKELSADLSTPEKNRNWLEAYSIYLSEDKKVNDAIEGIYKQCQDDIFIFLKPPKAS
jgi:hypothetical protein